MKNAFVILFVLVSSLYILGQDGYKIEVNIDGLSDTTVILGHYTGDAVFSDDTVRLNSKGKGIFKDTKSLPQGMYVVFTPDAKTINFLVGEDQEFALYTNTLDYNGNISFEGSPDNELLMKYNNYLNDKYSEVLELREIIKGSQSEKEKRDAMESINLINKERIKQSFNFCDQNPDLFASVFIRANIDIIIPDEIKSNQQLSYEYYKAHYFDNFDLSDVRLMRTPIYENKIMNYFDKIVLPDSDSINKSLDLVLGKAKGDSVLFRFLLNKFINKYATSNLMGMDAVTVHLAEDYFIPYAWWADESKIKEFQERVDALKPILLGNVAPDFQVRVLPAEHFKKALSDTAVKRDPHAGEFLNIHSLNSNYTILIFWEANCSHCKKIVPDLYKVYEETLKVMGVQVIAVHALGGVEGKEKWIDFVNKNGLYDWINAWNPYDYNYKKLYDLRAYPKLFLLNDKHEIIGKELMVENIADFIRYYEKYNSQSE